MIYQLIEFMPLTKKQIELLYEGICKSFHNQDEQLKDFLINNFPEEFLLKINFENLNNLQNSHLDSTYSQNDEEYNLLVIEAYHTRNINFEQEYNSIIRSIYNNQCIRHQEKEDYVRPKTASEMKNAISNKRYQIYHIFGHGEENGNSVSFKLTENNTIGGEELEKCLLLQESAKGVILNFCYSEKMAKQISHCDYVIGMSQQITDTVAIKFAKGFYDGLKHGVTHKQDIFLRGFREGLSNISEESSLQKNQPVLYISLQLAILKLIKILDAKNKIDILIEKIKNHKFINFSLHKFISYYKHPLTEDELKEIHNIISNNVTDDAAIKISYQKIFPDEIEIDKNTIVDKLVENNAKKSEIPLIVKFARQLAENLRSENALSKELRDWCDQILKRLGIQQPANNEDEHNQQGVQTDLWIIVDDEGDKLRLEASVMQKGKDIKKDLKALNLPGCEIGKGIICHSFEGIPFKLDEIIDFYKKEYELRTITVELFLSKSYIENNIFYDWLRLDKYSNTQTSTLVRENQIRVHLCERIKPLFFYPLSKRYKEFHERISKPGQSDKRYIPKREIYEIHEQIGKQDVENIARKLQEKICVKLSNKDKSNDKKYFFEAVLKAGTVLVFWLRSSESKDMSMDSIERLPLPKNYSTNKIEIFQKIIEKMHNKIQEANAASNPEEYLGYYLGFLCDDPNRIPPIPKMFNSFKNL